MTLTVPQESRSRGRATSWFHWVPTTAAWAVGIAATLSLLASMSPVIRWAIRVPREFIDKYLFNFPDTSLAWAFVLALLAAALSARKRIAWWLLIANLVVAGGWNISRLVSDTSDRFGVISGVAGLMLHVGAIVVLVLARGEFWAKVRRGALFKSAATLAAGWTVAILLCWGLVELFPGTVTPPLRLPYVVNRVVGFGLLEPDFFPGKPELGLRALCGL
ncbi:MAG: lysine--tRNA ligase, partial [Mycolicibacter arupensis]